MSYYISTGYNGTFDEGIAAVTAALQEEGFGIVSDIDVAATMKQKLDVDVPRYRILGACNPVFAHQALQEENKIGTLLPCNVVVRETPDNGVEIAAVDPAVSMQAVENAVLAPIAGEVQSRLRKVLAALG